MARSYLASVCQNVSKISFAFALHSKFSSGLSFKNVYLTRNAVFVDDTPELVEILQ